MRAALLLIAISGLAGCGSGKKSLGTVPVTGRVTYQGKPVDKAVVAFDPQESQRPVATGITDSNGRFQLGTLAPGDGAVPGEYAVLISKAETAAPVGGQMSPQDLKKAYEERQKAGGKTPDSVQSLIPVKYSKANTSGLTALIKAQKNDFTFELVD
jgi:hypothetical protein